MNNLEEHLPGEQATFNRDYPGLFRLNSVSPYMNHPGPPLFNTTQVYWAALTKLSAVFLSEHCSF